MRAVPVVAAITFAALFTVAWGLTYDPQPLLDGGPVIFRVYGVEIPEVFGDAIFYELERTLREADQRRLTCECEPVD